MAFYEMAQEFLARDFNKGKLSHGVQEMVSYRGQSFSHPSASPYRPELDRQKSCPFGLKGPISSEVLKP